MSHYPVKTELARAKINLTLHVGPRQADGYHPLQSLCAFADFGDWIGVGEASHSNKSSLSVSGPFAKNVPTNDQNLILKAAKYIGAAPKHFHLVKNLPPASGIGGGSADAAAALRLLGISAELPLEARTKLARDIGADIPLCLLGKTCLMDGIGERLTPLPNLGQIPVVMVNPGLALSTGKVFKIFDSLPPPTRPVFKQQASLGEGAHAGQNDLQSAAISVMPEILNVIKALEASKGCQLARMSGSGATCFGLFKDLRHAYAAKALISEQNPSWWCVAGMLGDRP